MIPAPTELLAPLSTGQFVDGARIIPYTIRPSRRCRYIRLTIRPDTGLVATVPPGTGDDQLARFLERHRGWIRRETDRLARVAARIPKRWPYGPTLPFLGAEHPVVLQPAPRPAGVERTTDSTLVVRMPAPTLEGARRMLKRWYLAEAAHRLLARTTQLGRHLGIVWSRVRVRDQRYRWGSCSVKGYLNFNYRLIMAPAEVLDYVVIHELCHRREMNHSARFWMLVAEHCPDYRGRIEWLNTEGAYLTL